MSFFKYFKKVHDVADEDVMLNFYEENGEYCNMTFRIHGIWMGLDFYNEVWTLKGYTCRDDANVDNEPTFEKSLGDNLRIMSENNTVLFAGTRGFHVMELKE